MQICSHFLIRELSKQPLNSRSVIFIMRRLPKERPLDAISLDILRAVRSSAHALNVPVMLVGATARDIMLTFLHGIPARRATEDMDFALAVPDWEAFENVARALTDDPRFTMGR